MELLADRDPEEARQLLDPVLERMMAAVHRYEGTVNQVMGDGIMALFGAPIAHEDHAVRACYAALAMQATVHQYAAEVQRTKGVPLQMRVGVNAGEVVVRAIGNDLHMDYSAVGQTTHLAARMEQMAMPGSILITPAVLRLTEGYVQIKPLGPIPVKGLRDPVEVFELVGASGIRRRLQATVARGLTRFVGRQSEVATLRQALERAGAGQGQVVATVGEPGVGKSRLVYEFVHAYHTSGWLVLESASVSYGKATPYFPVIDCLKRYSHVEEHDDARTIRAKVTGQILTLDATLQAIAELPEERLQHGLAHVQAAEFLYETQLFPERELTFKHALTHEVAYASLLQERRRTPHARIVEALERLAPDRLAEQVDRLAHHALRGGVWDKGLAYCRQAGAKAMARSAHHEAVGCFEQALAALGQLPESRDTCEQAIDLRCDLRNALLPLGEHARILDHLRAAETLATRLNDPQRRGWIACYLCNSFSVIGEYAQAIAAGQHALALATTSGACDLQVLAQMVLGVTYSTVGDFRHALDASRQVMVSLTSELHSARFGQALPAVVSRGHLVWSLAELGNFAEEQGVGAEAVRLAEAAEQPYSMAIALTWMGLLSRRQGALHRAISLLERGLTLCQTADFPLIFPVFAAILGGAYALAGRMTEALPLLDQTLERVTTEHPILFHALVLTELSEALLLVGRADEASALADRLLVLSHTHTGCGYQAHAYRLLGEVTICRDPLNIALAEAHYQQASPWLTIWACARSRRTATAAWVRSMPRLIGESRPAPNYPRPSRCTVTWR